jgi:hypothetical protein
MTEYVGRHRMPDNENEDTARFQRVRSMFTIPGVDYLFTHQNNPLHLKEDGK